MLVIVQRGVRRGICHSIYWYAKAKNKYMKDYDKNKECHIFHMMMWIIYVVEQCR